MKHFLALCFWLMSIGWFAASDASAQAATHSAFNAGGVPDIRPADAPDCVQVVNGFTAHINARTSPPRALCGAPQAQPQGH
jgi:hypothetical protein